jgi:hypothetical protein
LQGLIQALLAAQQLRLLVADMALALAVVGVVALVVAHKIKMAVEPEPQGRALTEQIQQTRLTLEVVVVAQAVLVLQSHLLVAVRAVRDKYQVLLAQEFFTPLVGGAALVSQDLSD